MEEIIDTKASPKTVWSAWEKIHSLQGQKGSAGKFKYKVLDVKPEESFSIVWKTLFVKMVFTHEVSATERGSRIRYRVRFKGLFAWPIRLILGEKIKKNLRDVLKAMVLQLER
jgi:hypothetical protein